MVTLWCLCTVLLAGIQLLHESSSGGGSLNLLKAFRIGGAGTSAIILGNLFLQWIREMSVPQSSQAVVQPRRHFNHDADSAAKAESLGQE